MQQSIKLVLSEGRSIRLFGADTDVYIYFSLPITDDDILQQSKL